MRYTFAASLALIALSFAQSDAKSATAISKSCAANEYHQFDFWIGVWQVFDPSGKQVGHSRIESILDGCGLLENWSGSGGVRGKSLNMYDPADRRWHQFWIDNSPSRLNLVGEFKNGKMVLGSTGEDSKHPGVLIKQRIVWTKIDDRTVRQQWETSHDSGKTWTTVFDGKYVRKHR